MKDRISSKFLSNAMIGELSRNPPWDLHALKAVIGGGKVIEKHTADIMNILKKY
jgi:ribonuclease D